jgi:putative ATP-dependent endonuclease of OLD family
MEISRVRMKNFRCFEYTEIHLESPTIIIGENSIGKTTLLIAMDKVLGFGRTYFEETDFYISGEETDPESSDPIIVQIELVPSGGADSFSEEEDAVFANDYFIGQDGSVSLVIRATHWYDEAEEEYKTEVRFIKEDVEHGVFSTRHKKALCFYLTAEIRDIEREVLSRRGLLPRLLGSIDLSDETEKSVEDLSQKINEIISSDPGISEFQEDLRETISKIIPLIDDPSSVALNPIPVHPREILRDSGISLHIEGQPVAQPIRAQGAGSQSILVLSIFEAYVKKLGVAAPIFGIEEPEAHLHPHAQRYVFRYLASKPTQVLISTHSTFITDLADPHSIRLLRRSGDGISVRSIPRIWRGKPFLEEKEKDKLRRTLNAEGSELFFARAVILVEGPSEKVSYPIFARAIGLDFDHKGISVLSYEGDDFHIFGKILGKDALHIPYLVQTDGEESTIKKAARRLKALRIITQKALNATGNREEAIVEELLIPSDVFPLWIAGEGFSFETYMMSMPGAVDLYMEAIAEIHGLEKLEQYIRNRGDLDWDSLADEDKVAEFIGSRHASKPALAQYVASRYTQEHQDDPVPDLFRKVIVRAVALSG